MIMWPEILYLSRNNNPNKELIYWRLVLQNEPTVVITNTRPSLYCNEFAGSISQWKFITLKIQYTTLDYSQQLF
jgi:hypothetical protein